jgi:hypothetical protein
VSIAIVRDRVGVAGVDGAEQFLGLTLQLREVRVYGQSTNGHDEPP